MAVDKKRAVRFVDAFAGCGGLSLGLMQAGCKGLFAIEKDQYAFQTLKANLLTSKGLHSFAWPKWLPQEPIAVDRLLTKYRANLDTLAGSVDLLVGGPPCQGFSSAGRRQHDDPRNQLFKSYLKLVTRLRPRAVLIENVRGFTADFQNKKGVRNYAEDLRDKLSRDFEVYEELVNVSDFGVPQRRTRYFLIALERGVCEGNPFEHLRRRASTFLRALRLQAPVSSWSAISDLEIGRKGRKPSAESPGFDEIDYAGPLTRYQQLMNSGACKPADLRLARHAEEIVARFAEIIDLSHSEGRLNTTMNEEARLRFGLKKRALRVLDPDAPSPTVTSMPDDLLHYEEARTLTVRENARLQSFPDWYAFQGKYTTGGLRRRNEVPRFTQVANAVPPLMARALGELLIEILRGSDYRPRATLRQKRIAKSPELTAQL